MRSKQKKATQFDYNDQYQNDKKTKSSKLLTKNNSDLIFESERDSRNPREEEMESERVKRSRCPAPKSPPFKPSNRINFGSPHT